MPWLFGLLLFPLFSQAADLSDLVENRVSEKKSKQNWELPTVEWSQTFEKPLAHDPEDPVLELESTFSFSYQIAKKQKIALLATSFHDSFDGNQDQRVTHQWGDVKLKYSNKNFANFMMIHKLSAPTYARSQERRIFTEYKGQYVWTAKVLGAWQILYNLIPRVYLTYTPTYISRQTGKLKANRIYDMSATAQVLYQIRDGFFISFDSGLLQERYHGLPNQSAIERMSYVSTASFMANVTEYISLALGIESEVATTDSSLRRPRLFEENSSLYYLETNISLF